MQDRKLNGAWCCSAVWFHILGSEKVGRTGAEGQRLEEAKLINKSLTMLGMVINALTDKRVWKNIYIKVLALSKRGPWLQCNCIPGCFKR